MPTVLIVGNQDDEHSDRVQDVLVQRGRCDVRRIFQSQVLNSSFEWTPTGDLCIGNISFPVSAMSGIWRRPGPVDTGEYAQAFREFVESETRHAFLGSLAARNIMWLSSPENLRRAELKLFQLQCAHSLEVPIPPTIVTNSARAAAEFMERVGDIIAKPVRYGLVSTEPVARVAWTSAVTRSDILELSGTPVILQQALHARAHYRITTVLGATFVAALRSDALDWRTEAQNHESFELIKEPEARLTEDAIRVSRALKIGFTTQDWLEDESGEFYFLEANPNGQWLFADPAFGGGITEAVVRALEQLAEVT